MPTARAPPEVPLRERSIVTRRRRRGASRVLVRTQTSERTTQNVSYELIARTRARVAVRIARGAGGWVFAAARRRARLAATPSAERSETKRNEAKNYLKNLPKPLGASPSVNPPAPPSSYSIIFEHLARPDGSRAHASMARTAAEMLASSPRSLQ